MSKHGNLLVGQCALRAIRVIAQLIVGFVVVFRCFYLWLEAVKYLFWQRRVGEVLRMKSA
jgi:hypothetical protein